MTLPERREPEFIDAGAEIQWGVSPDPAPIPKSPIRQLIWIILSILIILSLIVPWILPYIPRRRMPAREGIQAHEISIMEIVWLNTEILPPA